MYDIYNMLMSNFHNIISDSNLMCTKVNIIKQTNQIGNKLKCIFNNDKSISEQQKKQLFFIQKLTN